MAAISVTASIMARPPPTTTFVVVSWERHFVGSPAQGAIRRGRSVAALPQHKGRKKKETMKSVVIASLFVLAGTFTAQATTLASFPPPQYDVPYTGTLTIWRGKGGDLMCPNSPMSRAACTKQPLVFGVPTAWCDIQITDDKTLKSLGISYAFVLRHELAHCNGWPQDHADGIKMDASTRVPAPVLPDSTRYLPAYPPVVCITTERKIEPCKNRKPNGPGV
jgi:hypothetical protein